MCCRFSQVKTQVRLCTTMIFIHSLKVTEHTNIMKNEIVSGNTVWQNWIITRCCISCLVRLCCRWVCVYSSASQTPHDCGSITSSVVPVLPKFWVVILWVLLIEEWLLEFAVFPFGHTFLAPNSFRDTPCEPQTCWEQVRWVLYVLYPTHVPNRQVDLKWNFRLGWDHGFYCYGFVTVQLCTVTAEFEGGGQAGLSFVRLWQCQCVTPTHWIHPDWIYEQFHGGFRGILSLSIASSHMDILSAFS